MNHFVRVGTTERGGTQHRKEVELQKQKYLVLQYVGYPVCRTFALSIVVVGREELMTSLVLTRTAAHSRASHCCGTYAPETASLCEKGGRDGPTPAITIDASCHASSNPAVQFMKYLTQNYQVHLQKSTGQLLAVAVLVLCTTVLIRNRYTPKSKKARLRFTGQ